MSNRENRLSGLSRLSRLSRTSYAIFEGTLRVVLPWASPFALGWRLLSSRTRIGDGGSSPDGRKRASEGRNRLPMLFDL